ncbi:hypothetical protein [Streptomyces sp. NPDC060322]|uniref:hypothetical protein n=1 Tax=Streptomyces sp. NPDC060322 TaxID=3347097 RepID=UPI00365D22F1
MYDLDQISNAVAQLTGETLEGARLRLGALQRFDLLIPGAPADQALLESVLASALGAVDGQTRPFGVREAKPLDAGLMLRVERAEELQALLRLLPHRTKKGPWRGVRGLTVQKDGTRLRFGFRSWVFERSWRPVPVVWVAGPHAEDVAVLLAAHEEQVRVAGHNAQWDPQCPEPGPKRQEPATRSLVRQLSASSALGSALLRRPRLWDSLVGYAGVQVATQMTDYGLDWTVDRQVNGSQFDEARLIEVLTDHVVGCGLRLLDHACGTTECTVRLAPRPGMWGWRGVLTVRSHLAPASPHIQVPGPRPLTAIGDRLGVSRPHSDGSAPECCAPERGGAVVQLMGVPGAEGVRRDDLSWAAEQIAAVWACQGLATAVVLTRGRDHPLGFRDAGQPVWATTSVPKTVEGWRRLRISPTPGELWLLEVSPNDEAVIAALEHARRAYDRVILIGRNDDWPYEDQPRDSLADASVLVHWAGSYEREISLPSAPEEGTRSVALTPAESAVQWRQRQFGRWTPKRPLTGMLLLARQAKQNVPPDDFDLAVEEHLGRYGTPVLGRFPRNQVIIRGAGHSPHPPTVLDPENDEPTHAEMTAAAHVLAGRLWPHSFPADPSGERAM